MCGRYVSPEEGDIERLWNLTRIRDQIKIPNWNVSPTHQVPAIRRIEEGAAESQNGTELVALRWGLIPSWAKGVAPKFGTIMATCERLTSAPTWRGPWKQGRRCILPALGFYEWQTMQGAAGRPAHPVKRVPHYIRIGDQPVFGMAALWDVSIKEDGTAIESCAVITVPGNRVMNDLEYPNGEDTGRMPAILTRELREVWLRGAPDAAFACLKPYADELTIVHPVSSRVNSPKNNDAGLVS